ncbi:60S acidic ribosomal protein P0 [Myotis davidii]|uniref:Large ribosomal subunit protein uL10 n=1 Tax=Myotis davidii TaxID=225400 RepID=L5LL24_MYODS|nr:60S acidic ribosomal protein P0 [Myotis davidii]
MLHCGSRQCGLHADAADLHVPPREGGGADAQEHHDAQGHLRTSGKQPGFGEIAAHIWVHVGFVFTKEDLPEIWDMLLANKVPAAARAGAIALCEVTVPAQNTGLGPEKTSSFQALGITTKISRGTTEILSDVQLIKTGDKVGASEATLPHMLNISPFSSGLIIQQVFDNGSIYIRKCLASQRKLHSRFLEGVHNVARCCQHMPSDWLPNCCVSTPFYHQWLQASSGFVCGD